MNRIGKYEIQAEIGRGGFGRVYKGFDPTVGRVVAIKVLLPDATDPEFIARFRTEATTAGNLHHPNLVTIHEFGEENGLHYLVMEFLEGHDLQHVFKERTPMTLLDKVEIMQQVASGLDCAHESGVVHRDVKPSNVMVMKDNLVKLMDFGIARLTSGDTTRQTKAGFLVGTLNYMSPEQFRDVDVDALCDIWAFGVIYYEFLTGRFPFEGASPPAVLYSITSVEPPSPASLVPECPEALSSMIMRTLAKDRDLRYQSLQEFQLDVGPILLDLRRERARSLLPEAKALFEQSRPDEAMKLVRRILDLEPLHPEARQLREQIQRQSQQRAIVPKVGALLKSGQEQMQSRRYAEAIQTFENALRLDTTNFEIKKLLDEARSSVGQFKEAQELAERAARLADQKDFTGAHALVQQALRSDPVNQRAREVMTRVQHAFDSQERRQAVQQVLQQANRLLSQLAIDQAIDLLNEARGRLKEPPEILQLIQEAEIAKADKQLRDQHAKLFRQAEQLLAEERIEEAESVLEQVKPLPGDTAQVDKLLFLAAEKKAARQRAEAVRRVSDRVRSMSQDEEFDRALHLVDRALQEFPGESSLQTLRSETLELRRKLEERRAIDDCLRQARGLRDSGDLAGARNSLRDAITKFGQVPALVALESDLSADLRVMENRDAARKLADSIRALINKSEWARARAEVQSALTAYPKEPELTALLQSVERGLAEEEARQKKDRAIAKARQLRISGDLAGARQMILSIREQHGESPALAELEREIDRQEQMSEKLEAVAKLSAEARELIAHGHLDKARAFLRQSLQQFPAEPELTALLESVERGIQERATRQRKEEIIRNAKGLEGQGKDTEALAVLEDGLTQFPGDGELFAARVALGMRTSERQRTGDLSARKERIQQAIESGQFDLAKREIEDANRQFTGQATLGRLAEDLEIKRRLFELDGVAKGIEQALQKGALDEASQRLQQALRTHPRDVRLLKLQQALESETAFLEALRNVEQHIAARRLDMAEGSLRTAAGLKPDNDKVNKLAQRLVKEREKIAAERAAAIKRARELAAKLSFDEAGAILRGIVERNPSDREADQLLTELNAARGAHIKRQNYAARIKELETRRREDNPNAVKESAAVLLAEFPGDPQARALMDWAEQRLHELGATSIMPEQPAPGMPMWKIGAAAMVGLALAVAAIFIFKPAAPKAAWSISTQNVPFQWRLGEPLPEPKQIALSSARGIVKLSASSSKPWLNVDPAQATTPGAFTLAISPANMVPGEHTAEVKIETADAEPKLQTVKVTMKILPRAGQPITSSGNSMTADTDILSFNARQGSSDPETKMVRVRGNGIARVSASVRVRAPAWLQVNPSSATIPAVISVVASPAGLAPGTYQGQLILTAEGGSNISQAIPVSLRIVDSKNQQITQGGDAQRVEQERLDRERADRERADRERLERERIEREKPRCAPAKSLSNYAGLRAGAITWSGQLAPGAKLTITKDQPPAIGNAKGNLLDGDVPVTIEVPTAGIQILSAPSPADCYATIVLSNTSAAPVGFIQIRWRVKE